MTTIRIDLGERSYDVAITSPDLPSVGPFLPHPSAARAGVGPLVRQRCKGSLAFVVCDSNTVAHANRVGESLREAGFRITDASIIPGEDRKCLKSASELYDDLVAAQADRKTVVVA